MWVSDEWRSSGRRGTGCLSDSLRGRGGAGRFTLCRPRLPVHGRRVHDKAASGLAHRPNWSALAVAAEPAHAGSVMNEPGPRPWRRAHRVPRGTLAALADFVGSAYGAGAAASPITTAAAKSNPRPPRDGRRTACRAAGCRDCRGRCRNGEHPHRHPADENRRRRRRTRVRRERRERGRTRCGARRRASSAWSRGPTVGVRVGVFVAVFVGVWVGVFVGGRRGVCRRRGERVCRRVGGRVRWRILSGYSSTCSSECSSASGSTCWWACSSACSWPWPSASGSAPGS
jgi:hypothetical protein